MRDIVAKNGVIHILEDILIPESARTIEEAMEDRYQPTLKRLIQKAGFTMNDFANTTFFAPTETALKSLPKDYLRDLEEDQVRNYHVLYLTT